MASNLIISTLLNYFELNLVKKTGNSVDNKVVGQSILDTDPSTLQYSKNSIKKQVLL